MAWIRSTVPALSRSRSTISNPIDDLQLGELIGYIGGFLILRRRNQPQWTTLAGSSDRVLAKELTGAITAAEVGSVIVAAGDVIAPAGGREPVAWVASDGGALLGPQLLLFRVDAERVDPHFLAGFLRAGQAGGPSRGSSLLLRTDARRTPIPRVPLAQQRAYGEALRQLTAFEQKARQTMANAEQLVRLGFAGLADGTLQAGLTAVAAKVRDRGRTEYKLVRGSPDDGGGDDGSHTSLASRAVMNASTLAAADPDVVNTGKARVLGWPSPDEPGEPPDPKTQLASSCRAMKRVLAASPRLVRNCRRWTP